jgi:hypothetical protein
MNKHTKCGNNIESFGGGGGGGHGGGGGFSHGGGFGGGVTSRGSSTVGSMHTGSPSVHSMGNSRGPSHGPNHGPDHGINRGGGGFVSGPGSRGYGWNWIWPYWWGNAWPYWGDWWPYWSDWVWPWNLGAYEQPLITTEVAETTNPSDNDGESKENFEYEYRNQQNRETIMSICCMFLLFIVILFLLFKK